MNNFVQWLLINHQKILLGPWAPRQHIPVPLVVSFCWGSAIIFSLFPKETSLQARFIPRCLVKSVILSSMKQKFEANSYALIVTVTNLFVLSARTSRLFPPSEHLEQAKGYRLHSIYLPFVIYWLAMQNIKPRSD